MSGGFTDQTLAEKLLKLNSTQASIESKKQYLHFNSIIAGRLPAPICVFFVVFYGVQVCLIGAYFIGSEPPK